MKYFQNILEDANPNPNSSSGKFSKILERGPSKFRTHMILRSDPNNQLKFKTNTDTYVMKFK
jgi:hypothetical protein